MSKLKLALMDMNAGTPNQGMRGLREIVAKFKDDLDAEEFEVRQEEQVPDIGYDIYLSSGGPGDPREGNGRWDKRWFKLIREIWDHNLAEPRKKYVFLVCHSFQMACYHFGLCGVTPRQTTSFGIYPIHKTPAGREDPLLAPLDDPYFGVDSRKFQLVKPKKKKFEWMGAKVISLEKIRTHIEYERAIMAIRFSKEMVGTQFHPEADPQGMKKYFSIKKNRETIINNFDLEKYQGMMAYLDDPKALTRTHDTVIPGFIAQSIQSLSSLQAN